MEELPKPQSNKNEYKYDPNLSKEDNERLEQHFKDKTKIDLEEDIAENFQEEIKQLETLLSEFGKEYSIEYLNNITELSPNLAKVFPFTFDVDTPPETVKSIVDQLTEEEKSMYEIRSKAKNELISIGNYLTYLKNKTKIPEEEYTRLNAQYKIYSRAVGILNNDKIRHNL